MFPAVNTLLLVVSSLTAALGKRAIAHGQHTALRRWSGITLLLGLVFVFGQVYDFTHSGMSPSDAAFGGVFFALIGFHALHVLAGVVILGLIELRALLGDFSEHNYTLVEIGTWFWYFVTGIWLVLFTSLYLV
jgi:cytochrome c oxidase subunit 3